MLLLDNGSMLRVYFLLAWRRSVTIRSHVIGTADRVRSRTSKSFFVTAEERRCRRTRVATVDWPSAIASIVYVEDITKAFPVIELGLRLGADCHQDCPVLTLWRCFLVHGMLGSSIATF